MLFSLLTGLGTGSAPLFDGSGVLALAAVTLLAAATLWMTHRVVSRCIATRSGESSSQRIAGRSRHTPVLVRASQPDVPGRPRPRAPGVAVFVMFVVR